VERKRVVMRVVKCILVKYEFGFEGLKLRL
jgi:hypothetical protein